MQNMEMLLRKTKIDKIINLTYREILRLQHLMEEGQLRWFEHVK